MLDLLNLPGVRPVDLQSSQGVITITAEVIEATPSACPECSKPLYRHGHRRIEFADTPQQMQPVRLVIDRPRYRCESCGKTMTLDLPFLPLLNFEWVAARIDPSLGPLSEAT